MLSQIYTAVGLCFVLQIFQSDRLRKGRGSENIKHTFILILTKIKQIYVKHVHLFLYIHSISFAFASMHCLCYVFNFKRG